MKLSLLIYAEIGVACQRATERAIGDAEQENQRPPTISNAPRFVDPLHSQGSCR